MRLSPGMDACDVLDAAETVSEKAPFLVVLESPLLVPDATRREFAHGMMTAHAAYRARSGLAETDADFGERGVLFASAPGNDALERWECLRALAGKVTLGWAETPALEEPFVRHGTRGICPALLFSDEVEVRRVGPFIRTLSPRPDAQGAFPSASDACFADAATLGAMGVSKELSGISPGGSNTRMKGQFQRFGELLGLARRIISASCGEGSPQKDAIDGFCARIGETNPNRVEKLASECRRGLDGSALAHVEDPRLVECAAVLGLWHHYVKAFAREGDLSLPDRETGTLKALSAALGLDSAVSAYLAGVPYELVLPPGTGGAGSHSDAIARHSLRPCCKMQHRIDVFAANSTHGA